MSLTFAPLRVLPLFVVPLLLVLHIAVHIAIFGLLRSSGCWRRHLAADRTSSLPAFLLVFFKLLLVVVVVVGSNRGRSTAVVFVVFSVSTAIIAESTNTISASCVVGNSRWVYHARPSGQRSETSEQALIHYFTSKTAGVLP